MSRPNLAGLAVFWGWSILVNARDTVERHIASRLRHPMAAQAPQRPMASASSASKEWN